MLRVFFKSALVGFVTLIATCITAVLGAMIFSIFFAKNTSDSGGEVGWDLRGVLDYYRGSIWTPIIVSSVFLCGFAVAFRQLTRSPR
jgi:hypothetical protein